MTTHRKKAGTAGTLGTPSIHAGFEVPKKSPTLGTTGDNCGDIVATELVSPKKSPKSPKCPQRLGTRKPSIYAVSPKSPKSPTKNSAKHLQEQQK